MAPIRDSGSTHLGTSGPTSEEIHQAFNGWHPVNAPAILAQRALVAAEPDIDRNIEAAETEPKTPVREAGRSSIERAIGRPHSDVPGVNYQARGGTSKHPISERWKTKTRTPEGRIIEPSFSLSTYGKEANNQEKLSLQVAKEAAENSIRNMVNRGGGTPAQRNYFQNN